MEEVLDQQPGQKKLPNATGVLVLGILSLVFTCCNPVGLILGIIGLVISREGKRAYEANPSDYKDYGNLNAGRIMSIIGIVIGGILIIWSIVYFLITGAMLGQEFWENYY